MRTELTISANLKELENRLVELKRDRGQLNQIDLLSEEGANIDVSINQTIGMIRGLRWALEKRDKLTINLHPYRG